MELLVLVKAVPGLDELRFDAARGLVDRTATPLYLNPFDQRALRVALDLRRPGEKVTVVSMGPPAAADLLRDTVAAGADRAILVTDPHLAGSDTLATARVLATVARPLAPALVLAGAWTTDSETGQVGPEVAELLGLPAALGARSVERDPDGLGVAVTADHRDGWIRFRVPTPALIAVGEKIAKPIKVDDDARARVPPDRVERRDLSAIGLSPVLVGLRGSPTVVRWVREDRPARTPTILREGGPAARVAGALAALAPLLAKAVPAPAPTSPEGPPEDSPWRELLVLVTDALGALDPHAEALLTEPRRALPGFPVTAVWIGPRPGAAETARLGHLQVGTGFALEAPSPLDPRVAAEAFGRVLDRRVWAAAGMFLADEFGREVAARVAAARSLGLTGDAIDVGLENGSIVWTKPSFGGRSIAGIASRTPPSLATIRPGAWAAEAPHGLHEDLHWESLPSAGSAATRALEASGVEVGPRTPPLESHDVLVVVGMGVGGPDRLPPIREAAARWNAGLGATRRVVDAGWVPRQQQVGLTGQHLAPRLAVLLGVSGSANHLVGLRRARTLLAVNRDPDAPVFRDVDVGIVGTIDEVLPSLVDGLAGVLDRAP